MRNKSSISGTGKGRRSHGHAARNFLGGSIRQLFTDPSREHKQISTMQEASAEVLLAADLQDPPAS